MEFKEHYGAGFGQVQYSLEERKFLQEVLEDKLTEEYISKRPGPGGTPVHYIETWRAIELANKTFGFNGWSSSIIEIKMDYLDQTPNGRFNCGLSSIVRVTLKDGSYHEDLGYGTSDNQKHKGAALEQAKKKAVSDALKRALRNFGNALGLTVYDREHIKNIQRQSRRYGSSKKNDDKPKELKKNPHFEQTADTLINFQNDNAQTDQPSESSNVSKSDDYKKSTTTPHNQTSPPRHTSFRDGTSGGRTISNHLIKKEPNDNTNTSNNESIGSLDISNDDFNNISDIVVNGNVNTNSESEPNNDKNPLLTSNSTNKKFSITSKFNGKLNLNGRSSTFNPKVNTNNSSSTSNNNTSVDNTNNTASTTNQEDISYNDEDFTDVPDVPITNVNSPQPGLNNTTLNQTSEQNGQSDKPNFKQILKNKQFQFNKSGNRPNFGNMKRNFASLNQNNGNQSAANSNTALFQNRPNKKFKPQ